MHEDSPRVRAAKEADRRDLEATIAKIVRTSEDVAAWEIARYEAETGCVANAEDWAWALAAARSQARK